MSIISALEDKNAQTDLGDSAYNTFKLFSFGDTGELSAFGIFSKLLPWGEVGSDFKSCPDMSKKI
jgi:hypothetical protein